MNILDDLIRMKTNAQEDDMLRMFDEVQIYEKLSVDEKLRNIKTSEITRKKCPLLAGFVDGRLYETVLAELIRNIYLNIEEQAPEILMTAYEKTIKQQKQFEVLGKSIAHVEYESLEEYDHTSMKDSLVAIFTEKSQNIMTAVLIAKNGKDYIMYHGTYEEKGSKGKGRSKIDPIIVKGKKGIFKMDTYSVLGNNGYRFGTYQGKNYLYDVMIGPDSTLYLVNGKQIMTNKISEEDNNLLNMVKKNPKEFAEQIMSVIESAVGS